MLKRDFIMVQIEELGKVIAQMIFNRNSNGARKNAELIQTVYTSLKIEKEFLLKASLEEIRCYLNQDDSCGLQRMELAAKTLLEESYLVPKKFSKIYKRKAKDILEYIQKNDTTFSLERVSLVNDINNSLSD